VCRVLLENGVEGEFDPLSKDIAGNEYWVWKAMVAISPRVVVIEYNASLDPEESFPIEYGPFFNEMKKHRSGLYHGAGFSKTLRQDGQVTQEGGTVLFVSHDIAAVQDLCQRCVLLESGPVAAKGDTTNVIMAYLASSGQGDVSDLKLRKDRGGNGVFRGQRVPNELGFDVCEGACVEIDVASVAVMPFAS